MHRFYHTLCIVQIVATCKGSPAEQEHPAYNPQYGSPLERYSSNIRIKVDLSLIQQAGAKCFKSEMVERNDAFATIKRKKS